MEAAQRDWLAQGKSRRYVPAWVGSFLGHALLFVLLATLAPGGPRGAAQVESRQFGIVLRSPSEESSQTPLGSASPTADATRALNPSPSTDPLSAALAAKPVVDPTASLPRPRAVLGAGSVGESFPTTNTAGGVPGGSPGSPGTQAQTRVFGITGRGYKFVYVFDRSGSMGGSGHSALAAAKRELLASLASLDSQHQFQIVFYNDEPAPFRIDERPWRLLFATDQNKQLAAAFLDRVKADGATQHERPLMLALGLQPDVIFFLTDADQPALTPTQLRRVRQLNDGRTSINTIEFGLGPALNKENFLVELAQENGGQHAYVDVTAITANPQAGANP